MFVHFSRRVFDRYRRFWRAASMLATAVFLDWEDGQRRSMVSSLPSGVVESSRLLVGQMAKGEEGATPLQKNGVRMM
jgi:hypothetical protein